MKASSQVVLIADSPCYDEHTVEVDPVKVCILFFDTYCIPIYILSYMVEEFSILVVSDYSSHIKLLLAGYEKKKNNFNRNGPIQALG